MKKLSLFLCLIILSLSLGSCGKNPDLERFQQEFNLFCSNLSALDASINNIEVDAEEAPKELLTYIDQLKEQFGILAEMDFPEGFDFLEELCDQAYDYMSQAADAYHTAFEGDEFAENYSDFGLENYRRAYKRVQIIINYLHGEDPQDEDLQTE